MGAGMGGGGGGDGRVVEGAVEGACGVVDDPVHRQRATFTVCLFADDK